MPVTMLANRAVASTRQALRPARASRAAAVMVQAEGGKLKVSGGIQVVCQSRMLVSLAPPFLAQPKVVMMMMNFKSGRFAA